MLTPVGSASRLASGTQCSASHELRMIRLIGIDVDGTLLDSRRAGCPTPIATPSTRPSRAGIHVALVTGRSYPFARPVADAAARQRSRSSSATARSSAAMDGATLARRLLDRDVARPVLDADAGAPRRRRADLRPRRRTARSSSRRWTGSTRAARATGRATSRSSPSRVPLEDALVEDPIQVMFNGGVEAMRALADALRARGARRSPCRSPSTCTATSRWSTSPRPTATKGRALAWRAEQLGLDARAR